MPVKRKITRRNFIKNTAKGTAGLVFGAGISTYAARRGSILKNSPNDTIGVGLIGIGIRGKQLLTAIGLGHPDARRQPTEDVKKLFTNLELRGVADVYKGAEKYGMEVAEATGQRTKGYEDYREMLENKDIDAVIIATPDHWHATMGIDAVNAGKDIYIEKCMTHTIQETKDLVKAVKINKRIFQLGHQGRQDSVNKKAKEYVQQNALGKITLIQTFTNRNSANGAWQYRIPADASPETVDWGKFLGKAPWREFNLNRIYRWRCFWDYGTGLSGDLLTHEWDAVDFIMDLGIPHSAVASGGVYFWKDGREVPDVFQVALEYPEKDLTMTYNATLGNSYRRGKLFFGSDAAMDFHGGLNVFIDRNSQQYQEKIKSGELKLLNPMLYYQTQSRRKIEEITSATERWTIDTGLLYTFTEEGRMIDTTSLHFKDFFDSMRSRKPAACNEDVGFKEAITAHMATQSYLQGRKIVWDPTKNDIV